MKNRISYTLLILTVLSTGCFNEFLDLRPDGRRVIPETIADYQSLLDNATDMNYMSSSILSIISTDEYKVDEQKWNLITSPTQRNAYLWKEDIYEGEESIDWNQAYKRILYANIVIEGLNSLSSDPLQKASWETTMGSALFHRSLAFYELAQLFCEVYQKSDSKNKLGIPVRLESDVNLKTPRSSIEESYQQILKDLAAAVELLPVKQINKERPTRQAALALLARVYLQMGDYEKALEYAKLTIEQGGNLLDYKHLDSSLAYTFSFRGVENPEVIYNSRITGPLILSTLIFNVNPEFLSLYTKNDCRKVLFFSHNTSGQVLFKGSYYGSIPFFTGLALDEIYLIKAESLIRLNRIDEGKNSLLIFLKMRYKSVEEDLYIKGDLLKLIVEERKKQLFGRGLYWSDLKRFNLESSLQTTLVRNLFGEKFELKPLNRRYILPIPENAVRFGNLEQNSR